MIISFLGYAGIVVIGLSLIQKNRIALHLLNALGSAMMGWYALLIQDMPFLILEIIIIILNLFYWWNLKKEKK